MCALYWIHTLPVRIALVITFLLLSTAAASGATVTVGCAGTTGTFDYTSLTAALAALDINTGNEIIVSGTCTESFWITGFTEELTITGSPHATITSEGNTAIAFKGARLRLRNLTIGPAGEGVFIESGKLELTDCIIRGAGTVGLEVRPQAMADLNSTVIEDNMRGIELPGPGGYLFVQFRNIIRHNTIGINSYGGSIWFAGAGPEITDNVYGIRLRNRSSLMMNSPALFENNNFGIALTDSSALLVPYYGGGQTFRANGLSGDSNTAVIIAEGNSHVDLFGAQVINNRTHGVVLRDNSSIRLEEDTITGNSGPGVLLQSLSTARIYGGMNARGNSGGDLACSLNSFASGDRSGIAKMACLTFTRSTDPPLD